MNYRPDVIVNQEFIADTPVISETLLTPNLIGLNRLQIYKTYTGSFDGSVGEDVIYDFPDFIAGSVIETTAAVLDVVGYESALCPHVYITSPLYGEAEIDVSSITYDYNLAKITLPAALSVTFNAITGSAGSYAASTNLFTDENNDFIVGHTRIGDTISVLTNDGSSYRDILTVVAPGVESAYAVHTAKINNAVDASNPNSSLGAINSYGNRILTSPTETFVTKKVQTGDFIYLTGWEQVVDDLGASYAAEIAGTRVFQDTTMDYATGAIVAVGDVIYMDINNTDELVPSFYIATAGIISDTVLSVENADPTNPLTLGVGESIAYDIRHYGAAKTLNGAADTELTDGSYGAVGDTGSFGGTGLSLTGQERIFRSATSNWGAAATPPVVGDVIVVDAHAVGSAAPAAGAYATFVITQIDSVGGGGVETDLAVIAINTTNIGDLDTDTVLRFSIYTEATRAGYSRHGASYGAHGTGGAPTGKRLFTNHDITVDYAAAGVIIGDLIKDKTGTLEFIVTSVAGPGLSYALWVEDAPGSTLAPGDTETYFEHSIDDSDLESKLIVVSVTDETHAVVKNTVVGSPAETVAIPNVAVEKVHYKDTASNLTYKVGHTASGSDLTGTIAVTYTAKRQDYLNQIIAISELTYKTIFGNPTPANPLSLGLSKVFEVFKGVVYATQIADETLSSWKEGLLYSASSLVYQPIVCTQNELVLQEVIAHVEAYSQPDKKNEMITWICHKEVIEEVRTNATAFPGGTNTITKDLVTGATSIIIDTVDITAYGAKAGDVLSGTWTGGAATGTLTKVSIISIVGSSPAAGKSTITIVPQNGITEASSVLTAWEITDRVLTLAERATKQAAYTTAINNRRVRNLWPDTVEDVVSDTDGIFGSKGSDLTMTLPGWLLTCSFAGARAEYEPADPLTNKNIGSYVRLIDPMSEAQIDTIINGGNTYVAQSSQNNPVYALRALTTSVTDLKFAEESVTPQVDNFAISLRSALLPIMGGSRNNQNFLDAVMIKATAVVDSILSKENMKQINFISLDEDPDRADGFILKYQVVPLYSGSHGEIYIYV